MSRPWYATNARDLLDARRQGLLPQGPIVVTLVGGSFDETTLYVRPEMPIERLDWSMLVNLDVWVWANRSQSIDRVVALTKAVVRAKPKSLYLRFEDRKGHVHDVDCGSGTHRNGVPEHGIPPEHSFIFCPINSAGTRIGRALKTALVRTASGDHS